ncbi:MFS transporter [Phenylobacterium sp. LjRoot225]|uniref:spinster family MFS transporter n=1 Tax=Phenylobacterium sp. LjRoot225 TaxID=3342285 RepID=UPI003ECE6A62
MTSSSPRSLRYSWFALALLFVVALFNYVDRTILSIMQVALKQDLDLSDTQLGALTGLSFAVFYCTFALPLARLADRVARKYVLAAALTVWTLMTTASGLAVNYGTLLACRVGVAVGEAGCVPASQSLLSDFFPRHRRAVAMAVWGLALPLGGMLGFAFGGKLTAALGWRDTFIIVGLSGLVMAPVILLLLKEPPRGRFDAPTAAPLRRRSVPEALRLLWGLRSFRYLALGEALQAWAQIAMSSWNAPFYSRVHAMPIAEVATWLALSTGFGGAVGIFLGGALAERLSLRDVSWYMRVPAIAALLTVPFALVQYLTGDVRVSLVCSFIPATMVNVYSAPGNAVSQTLSPPDMRAFTAAVYMLVVNLVGIGVGPTVVGALSDLFADRFGLGDNALRYALATVVIPATGAAALFWLSSLHLRREMRPLHERTPAEADAEVEAAAVAVPN